jgi:pyruvate carboxylase
MITPFYDSLLVKVTAWGHTRRGGAADGSRLARIPRPRLATNLQFLENVIAHPLFRSGECTTRFIDDTPELFNFAKRRDRASRLLQVPRRMWRSTATRR